MKEFKFTFRINEDTGIAEYVTNCGRINVNNIIDFLKVIFELTARTLKNDNKDQVAIMNQLFLFTSIAGGSAISKVFENNGERNE